MKFQNSKWYKVCVTRFVLCGRVPGLGINPIFVKMASSNVFQTSSTYFNFSIEIPFNLLYLCCTTMGILRIPLLDSQTFFFFFIEKIVENSFYSQSTGVILTHGFTSSIIQSVLKCELWEISNEKCLNFVNCGYWFEWTCFSLFSLKSVLAS